MKAILTMLLLAAPAAALSPADALRQAQADVTAARALADALAARKPAAPPPAPAPAPCPCPAGGGCTCACQGAGSCRCGLDCTCPLLHYDRAYATAVQTGKPLVVWVSVAAQALPGLVHCRLYSFPGVREGVVVSTPDGRGGLTWRSTLPAGATAADVRRVLEPPAQAAARPPPGRGWAPAPVFRGGPCGPGG